MKRIWLVVFLVLGALLLGVVGLWGWARGGSSGPEVRTINLSVLSQILYGAGPDAIMRVRLGDTVILRITADEAMEVFLHGYDLEAQLKPGETGILQFTANILGRYPFMIHSLGEDEGSQKRVEILLGLMDVLPRK